METTHFELEQLCGDESWAPVCFTKSECDYSYEPQHATFKTKEDALEYVKDHEMRHVRVMKITTQREVSDVMEEQLEPKPSTSRTIEDRLAEVVELLKKEASRSPGIYVGDIRRAIHSAQCEVYSTIAGIIEGALE